ncbi:DNA repair protein rad51d [Perkinsus olseni]|uniref:DNA repair protein rad51d n=1 Tax=Perkinsus olseni TaxID=32597 RepID=A0A7J6MXC0_PEROL|nr:DNA repair protein rad51d [Perkinsus olseni]KAF4676245.1 DNA repair protein rad51d [Perkinsus olseni]
MSTGLLPIPGRVQQSLLAGRATPEAVRKACAACGVLEGEVCNIIKDCESFIDRCRVEPSSVKSALKEAGKSLSFLVAGIRFSASCGIIELCGGPASSKTQLCMQLAATASACSVAVHYIDADGNLSITRLQQLGADLAQITVIRPLDWAQLAAAVDSLSVDGEAVIIIDSITHLLRHLPSMPSMSTEEDERGVKYAVLANIAATLSHFTQCITVVTNQLTTDISTGALKPALGDVWTAIIDQRIMLNNVEGGIKSVDVDGTDDAWLIEIISDGHAVQLPDI